MDDIVGRADDYEQRLIEAGSTQGIMTGLVRRAEQNERITKWLVLSVIVDVVLSLFLAALTFVAYTNDHNVDKQAKTACVQSAKNSIVINQFLEFLIDNAKTSTALSPSEIQQRITGYEKLIIKIPKCV